jgi:hypothetical protein
MHVNFLTLQYLVQVTQLKILKEPMHETKEKKTARKVLIHLVHFFNKINAIRNTYAKTNVSRPFNNGYFLMCTYEVC